MNKREIVCYESDASRMAGKTERVFFPESAGEVQEIAKSTRIDIVPRGSGTGLAGGCVPNNSAIVDLSLMNKVSNFLPVKKTVHVQAGITLKELNEKLNAVGFEFPIDTSNMGISTIGGMIATNASGERSMRYGTIKDWIEEIEFVNGRGELMKTRKADINDVCGMEGITGIIVGATLKLASLIKRTASAFQSENLDEVLSVARKLKSEKEVVILQLFSPFVSKLLGLPEKYNLIVEFNSDRGKIKDKDYIDIEKIREKVYYSLASKGYFNSQDPKFFFDKLKEFMVFLEENQVPYFAHLGVGIIHPFFKDDEKNKIEIVADFIRKIKATPGKYGIGITRKHLMDSFQAKLIQRVKLRHDPFLKFNNGKVIDIEAYKKIKTENQEEEKNFKEEVKEEIIAEIKEKASEKISEEKTPQEKLDEFLQEVEIKDWIKEKNEEKPETKTHGISRLLQDYEDTFKSELKEEKFHKVEEIAKNIPKELAKKEIFEEKINGDSVKGEVVMKDNLERKSENLDDDIIKRIMTNRFKEGKKQNGN